MSLLHPERPRDGESWPEFYARQRHERAERRARLDAETQDAVRALGITADDRHLYDLVLEVETRRGRTYTTGRRVEHGLRFSGGVQSGLAEFYVRRPAPDGPEQSRYIDPATIIEAREATPRPPAPDLRQIVVRP